MFSIISYCRKETGGADHTIGCCYCLRVQVVEFPGKVKAGVDNQVRTVETIRDSAVSTFNFVKSLVPKPKETAPGPVVPKSPPKVSEIWEPKDDKPRVADIWEGVDAKKDESAQPIVTLTSTSLESAPTAVQPALEAVAAAPEVMAKLQEIPPADAAASPDAVPIVTLQSKVSEDTPAADAVGSVDEVKKEGETSSPKVE